MAVRGMQKDIVENWAQGVITAALKDRLPDGAVSLARNTQFFDVGPDQAVIGTRMGMLVQNTEPLAAAVTSQHYLNTDNQDSHILTLADGSVLTLSNGTPNEIAAAGTLTAGDSPSWATFTDQAYMVNGSDALKTDGTGVSTFGIRAPADNAWTLTAGVGGGVVPAGDYRVVITYVNSATGREGEESVPKSVTITSGNYPMVTLPSQATVGDSQVDYARIYIEQSGVRNNFFLVAAGTTPAITDSGFPLHPTNTTAVVINPTAAQIAVFRILSPGINNHQPPPVGARHVVARQQRLWVATATEIYWSEVGEPEYFNQIDNVLTVGEDGEVITGLAVLGDALIIFKRNRTYALTGVSPASWEIVQADPSIGCAGHTSIGYADGQVWWMSLRGPRRWSSSGMNIVDISTQFVGNLFDPQNVNEHDLANAVVVVSPTDQYVGWAVQVVGQSANNTIIPYNYVLSRWMSSGWDVVDITSSTVVTDVTGRGWPMLGDASGFVYQMGTASQDGVPPGEVNSGFATSTSSTTLTDSSQSWATDCWVGRYVWVYSPTQGLLTAQRQKVTANSATELTVAGWSPTPATGARYVIGGVLMDWQGAERNAAGPFFKKRIEFLFIDAQASAVGEHAQVLVYKDGDLTTPILNRVMTIGEGEEWGEAIWGESVWANRGFIKARIPIRSSGWSWQIRLLQLSDGKQLSVQRTAVQWLTKTKKIGQMK